MKIFIPNLQEGKIGGGMTFTKNFIDLASDYITSDFDNSDTFFISGVTLVSRDIFNSAKDSGKKIVVRVDGVPEDARNRGTGWSRLKDYTKEADLVIYQSDFVKRTVGKLLGVVGPVIYNGVDKSVFNTKNIDPSKKEYQNRILFVNYRKAEQNKRVEEAIERFRYHKVKNPNAFMQFVGLFPKNIREWNFWMLDNEKGKDWNYFGVAHTPVELAQIMKEARYIAFPSFADPCPNTLIEAMSCGCKPLWLNDYGGQHDIVRLWHNIDWSRERMIKEYIEVMEGLHDTSN